MNRLVCYYGYFVFVSASIVTVMATATRASAEPIALSATLTLDELIALSNEELAEIDIAAVNLACAEGLPGSELIDRRALLAKLDVWAGYVAYETQRHRYRFEQHPEEYNNSWSEFAMFMMAMTLQQDLGFRYNPDQITPEDDPSGFDFTRSQDLFINGLLDGTGGTCTSMPVLYVAIGRRLGYPLKLVTSVDHSFLRWDDPETGERFNIEGTTRGYGSYSDESYRHYPREWNDAERDTSNYLESLTPREELAVFLTTRGDNLFFTGRLRDSLRCYEIARRMSPRNYSANYQYEQTARLIARLEAQHRAERVARKAEAAYQRIMKSKRNQPRIIVPGMPAIGVPTATANGIRPLTGRDFAIPRSKPRPTGPRGPWVVDFSSLNLAASPVPIPPSSRDRFEAMKRRYGVRPPDGSFPVRQLPMIPSVWHPRSNVRAMPIAPIPKRTQHGARP